MQRFDPILQALITHWWRVTWPDSTGVDHALVTCHLTRFYRRWSRIGDVSLDPDTGRRIWVQMGRGRWSHEPPIISLLRTCNCKRRFQTRDDFLGEVKLQLSHMTVGTEQDGVTIRSRDFILRPRRYIHSHLISSSFLHPCPSYIYIWSMYIRPNAFWS